MDSKNDLSDHDPKELAAIRRKRAWFPLLSLLPSACTMMKMRAGKHVLPRKLAQADVP